MPEISQIATRVSDPFSNPLDEIQPPQRTKYRPEQPEAEQPGSIGGRQTPTSHRERISYVFTIGYGRFDGNPTRFNRSPARGKTSILALKSRFPSILSFSGLLGDARLPRGTTHGRVIRREHRKTRTTAKELHMQEEYERLRQMVEAAADDVAKTVGGNKAAGTRVRKAMQDIKAAAQEVRKKVLEGRSEPSAP